MNNGNGNYLLFDYSKRSRNENRSSSASTASNSPDDTRSKSTSSLIFKTYYDHESSFSSSFPTLPTIYENDDDTTIGEINIHLDDSSSFSVDNTATTSSTSTTNTNYDDREVYSYYNYNDDRIMRREDTEEDSTSSYTDDETDNEYVGEIKVRYEEKADEESQDKAPPLKLIKPLNVRHSNNNNSQLFPIKNGVHQTQRNGSLADKKPTINPAAEKNQKITSRVKSPKTSARSSVSDSESYKENKISKSTNSKQSTKSKSHDEVIEISSQDNRKVKGINSVERHQIVHELKNLNDQFVECICQEFKLIDTNLKTLVKNKCKGTERKMLRTTEYDTYEYDYFGNVHKKKFPYYPFGIIRQQSCTKPKPKNRSQEGYAKPKSGKINPKWVN